MDQSETAVLPKDHRLCRGLVIQPRLNHVTLGAVWINGLELVIVECGVCLGPTDRVRSIEAMVEFGDACGVHVGV